VEGGPKKRILFLADRNMLIDQTMVNDFRPFGAAMAKLSTSAKTIERADGTEVELPPHRCNNAASTPPTKSISASTRPSPAPKSGRNSSASSRPDFFDLIVIDECHRGSAAEDSAWREILDLLHSATQIGLTATPKETEVRLQHPLLRRAGLHLP
jgi:type I restriction enzyme R subunit